MRYRAANRTLVFLYGEEGDPPCLVFLNPAMGPPFSSVQSVPNSRSRSGGTIPWYVSNYPVLPPLFSSKNDVVSTYTVDIFKTKNEPETPTMLFFSGREVSSHAADTG